MSCCCEQRDHLVSGAIAFRFGPWVAELRYHCSGSHSGNSNLHGLFSPIRLCRLEPRCSWKLLLSCSHASGFWEATETHKHTRPLSKQASKNLASTIICRVTHNSENESHGLRISGISFWESYLLRVDTVGGDGSCRLQILASTMRSLFLSRYVSADAKPEA